MSCLIGIMSQFDWLADHSKSEELLTGNASK